MAQYYRYKESSVYRVVSRVKATVGGGYGSTILLYSGIGEAFFSGRVFDAFVPGDEVVLCESVLGGARYIVPAAVFDSPYHFTPEPVQEPAAVSKEYPDAHAKPQDLGRPSWDSTGMELARVFAARSTDPKYRVGAVILSRDSKTVVGAGLNGRYPGCPTEERASLETGCGELIHAEQQAIVRARWEPGEKHVLFSTLEPCHECALLILAARHINRVVFESSYAGDGVRRRGSEILKDAGVEVVQWK